MAYWNRLPEELVECPSLEIFRNHLDIYVCDLLLTIRRLDLISGDPYQPLRFCDSVNNLGINRIPSFLCS